MDPEPTIRFRLEIHSWAPMRGLLLDDDERACQFEGWLQLLTALQHAFDTGTGAHVAGG